MQSSHISPSTDDNHQDTEQILGEWLQILIPAIESLRLMAGTTEDQFLMLGSKVQGFYQQSVEITRMSTRLIDIVSGDNGNSLTTRLQQMIDEMQRYLSNARRRSVESCATLQKVQDLLESLSTPLEGFQKMNKTLRMLSISTKIESSRLGESGSGFVNLAMDVEKLSHQVNDKSVDIMTHRVLLANLISANLEKVRTTELSQDQQVRLSLKNATNSLNELVSVNERCARFAGFVSSVSADVTENISNAVSLLQMHDMTRQQLEHVVEALERLTSDLSGSGDGNEADDNRRRKLIVETGDVCELQEAQLKFASSELYSAVCGVLDCLREVAGRQQAMALETSNVAATPASGGDSFVDVISQGMKSITSILVTCAEADRDMADTMSKVARTIGEIAVFVSDIEEIGTEIDLIALNAQVKAAHTGPEGAALGVLAEAIKRLSDEAVRQTDRVASILNDINSATSFLSLDSGQDDDQSGHIEDMQGDLNTILGTLGSMNSDLAFVMRDLNNQVFRLTADVEQTLSEIDVHERTNRISAGVLSELERIVGLARRIEPASSEFKQNLLHMEKRYTMESERHIHEALERKRSGKAEVQSRESADKSVGGNSGFGDNVDLF